MAPPDISLKDIYWSVETFVGVMQLSLLLVIAFPRIALWLPEQVSTK